MNRRTIAAEYNEPTLNGRPALSVDNVQQWFKKAFNIVPAQADAAPIAQALNHCALFAWLWKGTPTFRQMRRNNPSTLRMRRIGEALATLQKDLPILIADTRRVHPNVQSEGLLTTITLLDSVNLLASGFQRYKGRGRGREPEGWHRIARNLRPMVLQVLRSSGITRAGFGKPTSPAIRIMESALAYLDVRPKREAIVDAMRARTKRVGK